MQFLTVVCTYGHVTTVTLPSLPLGPHLCPPLLVCRLFRERLDQVKVKLDEVLTGKAGEYREPLATLQKDMQLRTQVAGNSKSATNGKKMPCSAKKCAIWLKTHSGSLVLFLPTNAKMCFISPREQVLLFTQ